MTDTLTAEDRADIEQELAAAEADLASATEREPLPGLEAKRRQWIEACQEDIAKLKAQLDG